MPIFVTEAGFDPPTVTVAMSDTVRWINHDTVARAIVGETLYQLYLPLARKGQ